MNNYNKFGNKFFSYIFILTLLITNFSFVKVSAATPPPLTSEGIVLLDADNGNVLYEKNGDKQFFPASTTKVLTALIVLENAKLDDKVTVGKNPPFADGTSIGLKEGEVYTIHELLLGLLLESGNDCAEALAEHISGSNENFAKLMNDRAVKLGAVNSNFKNPSGLPDNEHVTTPKDLALIMREANKNVDFVNICSTYSKEFSPSTLDGHVRVVNNHNYILFPKSKYYYPFSVASKKGYTVAAKFTNVISAKKDGHTLIASFLKGENINTVYSDVNKVFDYGFENFKRVKVYSEGDEIDSITLNDNTVVPLIASKDIYYTTDNDNINKINTSLDYESPTNLDKTDFKKGDVLTTAKVIIDGNEFSVMDIVSGVTHEYNNEIAINNFIEANKVRIAILISLFILFLGFLRVRHIKKKRKRRHEEKLRKIANRQNTQFK